MDQISGQHVSLVIHQTICLVVRSLQYDQNMMEPQLISSCSLLELFFEEEEDLMGSEISRIYFPTRKRDRTTISHEIQCEIILKRDTGIHGPLIWSEFPEENGGSTDGRISPKKGHHGDPRTADFVQISKRRWGIHGRPN